MTAPEMYDSSLAPLPAPSKPSSNVISTATQGSRRYWDTYFDSHRDRRLFPNGRPWTGQREQKADNPGRHHDGFIGGELSPGEHITDATGQPDRRATFATVWDAPFLPEIRYFQFNDQQKKIYIRYDTFRRDLVRAEQEYYLAAAKVSMQVSGVSIMYGVRPGFQVIAVVGEPPLSPRFADALIADDRWALGMTDEVNVEVARMLGMNERGETMYGGSIFLPPPAPIVSPAQIIAAPTPVDLERLIAEGVAKALAAHVAATAAKKPKGGDMTKARAAKAANAAKRAAFVPSVPVIPNVLQETLQEVPA